MDSRYPSSFALLLAVVLGGCGRSAPVPGDSADRAPFHAIAEDEAVNVTGTEPFWSGEVVRGRFTYVTPESPGGAVVAVKRFAGRGGVSFSGALNGKALTLAVTPGACGDGMSDREYPFVATLRLGDELHQGCGWTDRQRWRGRE